MIMDSDDERPLQKRKFNVDTTLKKKKKKLVKGTAFVDTSLGTRMVMEVQEGDTVVDFKKRIEQEHTLCYPEIGEIGVNALKVKHKGVFYHLSDLMQVQSAFDEAKRKWFVCADACRLGGRGLEIAGQSDLNDVIGLEESEMPVVKEKEPNPKASQLNASSEIKNHVPASAKVNRKLRRKRLHSEDRPVVAEKREMRTAANKHEKPGAVASDDAGNVFEKRIAVTKDPEVKEISAVVKDGVGPHSWLQRDY